MTQEDKELLIKDLSARLQYNVKILADIDKTFEDGGIISTLKAINLKKDWVELQSVLTPFKFDEIKPYLRLMSSMTSEEEYEYHQIRKRNSDKFLDLMDCNDHLQQLLFPIIIGTESIDWLNAHFFDYRGLIVKGLAIKVTNENNPYKE